LKEGACVRARQELAVKNASQGGSLLLVCEFVAARVLYVGGSVDSELGVDLLQCYVYVAVPEWSRVACVVRQEF
jgi:hypothetical protein